MIVEGRDGVRRATEFNSVAALRAAEPAVFHALSKWSKVVEFDYPHRPDSRADALRALEPAKVQYSVGDPGESGPGEGLAAGGNDPTGTIDGTMPIYEYRCTVCQHLKRCSPR